MCSKKKVNNFSWILTNNEIDLKFAFYQLSKVLLGNLWDFRSLRTFVECMLNSMYWKYKFRIVCIYCVMHFDLKVIVIEMSNKLDKWCLNKYLLQQSNLIDDHFSRQKYAKYFFNEFKYVECIIFRFFNILRFYLNLKGADTFLFYSVTIEIIIMLFSQ